MRPAVFFLLSLLPFIVYVHTSSFYLASFFLGLTTLFCCYCHYIQLQRQRISCTLGIISDPDILELVAKSMPGWVISSEKNRVDWLNQLLQYSWPYMGAFAETKLSAKIKEIFQREKPELLTSMELTNVVAGTIPPKIISIKALHTGSSIPKTVSLLITFLLSPHPSLSRLNSRWSSFGYPMATWW